MLCYRNPSPHTPFSLPHVAKPKGPGRPAASFSSQANLGSISHPPPLEAEELFLLQKALPTLSLEQKASTESSSTRGVHSQSRRQLKRRLLMEKCSVIWTTGTVGNKPLP